MNTRKPRVNKKRIAKAMKPLNGLNFPGSVSHIPEKIEFPKAMPLTKEELFERWKKEDEVFVGFPEPRCSVWSFVVPTLLILGTIMWYYAYDYYVSDCENITMMPYVVLVHHLPIPGGKGKRIPIFLDEGDELNSVKALEVASADLENGHWAKADRELHNLKLQLEGK